MPEERQNIQTRNDSYRFKSSSIYGWSYFGSNKMIAGPADFLISWIFPAVAVLWFWTQKQASPGKSVLSLRVVDAGTGKHPTIGLSIGRYLGYFVSMFPLGLGLLWVGWDGKKHGWHDKLVNTVVVRSKKRGTEHVLFPQA